MPGKDNYIKKASKFYQEGKYQDSIYWFSRAIAVDSKNPEIYAERAVAYFHFGDLKKSLDDLNELIFEKINKIDGVIKTETSLFLNFIKRQYDWGTALY